MKKLLIALTLLTSISSFSAEVLCGYATDVYPKDAFGVAQEMLNKEIKNREDISSPTIAQQIVRDYVMITICVTAKSKEKK